MIYNIKLTNEFLEDIEEICRYISKNLNDEIASKKLRKKAINNILKLESNPKLFAEIEKIDNVKRRYRRMVINNYVILYTIDENNKTIFIAHMYYGGKNYLHK